MGRALLVRGSPHGGACCGGASPPSWWDLLCWCLAPVMVRRAVLARVCVFVVSGLVSVTILLVAFPERTGRHLERVRCVTPCCCSRVSLPCGWFTLVVPLISYVRAVAAGCPCPLSLPSPPPWGRASRVSSLRRCIFALLSVLVGCCPWPPAGGCCRRQCPPFPPAGVRFPGVLALLLAFACWRAGLFLPLAFLLSPGVSGFLLHPPPSWFVLCGCCRPAAYSSLCAPCLFVAALFLVCRRAWPLAAAPPPPPPPVCVSWVLLLRPVLSLVLPLPSRCCAPVCRLFPPGAAPPPPLAAVLRVSSPLLVLCGAACCFVRSVLRCTLACLFVLRVLCGAALYFLLWLPPTAFRAALLGAAPFPAVLCLTGLYCLRCAVLCHRALLLASVSCVASFGAVSCCGVWCGACALLCRGAVCCALPLGMMSCCAVPCWSRCVLLFVVICFSACCAVSLGTVLRRVASCCSVRCIAVVHGVICVVLCCFLSCCLVLLRAVPCPQVLCCALYCAVLCCCVLCCALGFLSGSAVLCCSRSVLLLCLGLLFCVLCCVPWCCAALPCVVLIRGVQCCCALYCLRDAVRLFLAFFGAVACCAVPSGAVSCCGALYRLVRLHTVLLCALCAVLCVLCRFVVVLAVSCCFSLCCLCVLVSCCVCRYVGAFSKTERPLSC